MYYTSVSVSASTLTSTRMHSSRMRAARLLTVSQHALGGGVCIPACIGQGRCVSQHALGRGCLPSVGGDYSGAVADTPSCEQNGRCKKHYLAATSLWAVMMTHQLMFQVIYSKNGLQIDLKFQI